MCIRDSRSAAQLHRLVMLKSLSLSLSLSLSFFSLSLTHSLPPQPSAFSLALVSLLFFLPSSILSHINSIGTCKKVNAFAFTVCLLRKNQDKNSLLCNTESARRKNLNGEILIYYESYDCYITVETYSETAN